MTHSRKFIKPSGSESEPLTVGIVRCAQDIIHLDKLWSLETLCGDFDAIEFRLDCLDSKELKKATALLSEDFPLPTIMTARHPIEGGKNRDLYDINKRGALLRKFLPYASAIDVEVRFIREVEKVLRLARESGVLIIGSLHELKHTPDPSEVVHSLDVAAHKGFDVFKFASQMSGHAHDIETLLFVLRSCQASKILPSVMGMGGQIGRSSRPLLASLGSWLNYGYIAKPASDWEWKATDLRDAIRLGMIQKP